VLKSFATQSLKLIHKPTPENNTKALKIKLPAKLSQPKPKQPFLNTHQLQNELREQPSAESIAFKCDPGYFQDKKLSIAEADKMSKFGTVKNSICSQIMPAGSLNRAATTLNLNKSPKEGSLSEMITAIHDKQKSSTIKSFANTTEADPVHLNPPPL